MKNRLIFLVVITLIAGILRFSYLDKFPVAPNWDEVSHGYNAYSVLKTGKDEWGKNYPIIFRAFGDYKLPGYIYLTILPVLIFGLNVFSVRFISALAGTLAVPGIYWLVESLYPKSKIKIFKFEVSLSSIAAVMLTVLPWHFFLSRPALEANLALTLIIFGFLFLLKGLKQSPYYLLAAILLSLSIHTYNSARVFVPLMILAFVFIYFKELRVSKSFIIGTVILGVFFAVVGAEVLSGEGTARYDKLKLVTDQTAYIIGQRRLNSKLPSFISKVVYNRPVYFVGAFVPNYLNYFSPYFFTQPKSIAQSQFAIPGENILGPVISILFLLSFVYLLKNKNSPENIFVLAWLLLSPVAAALTIDPPQTIRPTPMIPAIVILATLSLRYLSESLRPKLFQVAICLVIFVEIFSFTKYLNEYFVTYAYEYSKSWQYGNQELYDYLKTVDKDKNVIITKTQAEPHIFYAFFNRLDPQILGSEINVIRYQKSDWFWVDRIGNYYFINDYDVPKGVAASLHTELGTNISTESAILVSSLDSVPQNAKIEKIIKFLDQSPAFAISTFK